MGTSISWWSESAETVSRTRSGKERHAHLEKIARSATIGQLQPTDQVVLRVRFKQLTVEKDERIQRSNVYISKRLMNLGSFQVTGFASRVIILKNWLCHGLRRKLFPKMLWKVYLVPFKPIPKPIFNNIFFRNL